MSAIVEQRLSQKLMLLENGVARIASMKAELRANAEKVRRDVAAAVKHQISCLRAREQELLSQLDQIVAAREESFSEQQDVISKAIGACQNSFETIKTGGCESLEMVEKMLIRLNALSLKPKGNPSLAFEFDPSESRLVSATFGNIFTDVHQQLESLPMDMEIYEDDFLSHKTVMRLPAERDLAQSTISEDSNCSFEIISPEATDKSPIVGTHIDEIVKSDNCQWLREDCQTPIANNTAVSEQMSCHSASLDDFRPSPRVANKFKFGRIIKEIQESENKSWLVDTRPSTSVDGLCDKIRYDVTVSTPVVSEKAPDTSWLRNYSKSSDDVAKVNVDQVVYMDEDSDFYHHEPFLKEVGQNKENKVGGENSEWLAR
ncbi:unnamed protein product [Bursaphelenchus okinawaensis]|uniref:Nuclear receptor coactivator 4 N-terminal domain-containing protein n=1 Tax=Bursaphelenchus okinawaensis TaxID=465554 RepID=A0A811KWV2_9BILA|nr:unnamed protein product [Bursaphelenchus okinawaensis]CAG9113148.1 unnamed protein product [Bursaphelenchus okinawaensis]